MTVAVIVMTMVVMAIVALAFVICPANQYSCQVTRAVSLVFGLMALALTTVLLVGDWRDRRKIKKAGRIE